MELKTGELQPKTGEEPLFKLGDHVESNPEIVNSGGIGTIIDIRSIRQVEGPDEITYLVMYDGGSGEKAWWPELTLTLTGDII
jgi:hypothetical protein